MIRDATISDAERLSSIYAEAIAAGAATPHVTPPGLAEFKAWLFDEAATYHVAVATDEGGIHGWCAIRRFHERAAYSPTGELLVYVAGARQGHGQALVSQSLEAARAMRLHSLVVLASGHEEFLAGGAHRLGFVKSGQLPAALRGAPIGVFQIMLSQQEGAR